MAEKALPINHVLDGIIDFTAGSLGGIALVYVGQPLDTVKVKMQTFPHLYNNSIDCLRQCFRNEGFTRGLYAGTTPALVCNVAENSVLFMCYGMCQKLIQKVNGVQKIEDLSPLSNASAGFMASFFSSVVICPTELVKCKLQAMQESQKTVLVQKVRMGPSVLVKSILRSEGVPGLFRGFVPTVAREMPGYFFFFGGYEGTRAFLTPPNESKENIGLFRTMVAGAVGGCLFWGLTFPIDVAKSRIQISNSNDNLVRVILGIFKNEGFGAIYNGLGPTLIRTIPATAVLFATYEYSKKFMNFLADR